jgi:hypothetical protein
MVNFLDVYLYASNFNLCRIGSLSYGCGNCPQWGGQFSPLNDWILTCHVEITIAHCHRWCLWTLKRGISGGCRRGLLFLLRFVLFWNIAAHCLNQGIIIKTILQNNHLKILIFTLFHRKVASCLPVDICPTHSHSKMGKFDNLYCLIVKSNRYLCSLNFFDLSRSTCCYPWQNSVRSCYSSKWLYWTFIVLGQMNTIH